MAGFTEQQKAAMRLVVDAVLDAVKAVAPAGAPGGVIYAGLMGQGCTFTQYTLLMGALVRTGKLRQDGDLYFIKGK